MINSKISLVIFTVLFTIVISSVASFANVDGISCGNPTDLISQPDENITTFETAIDSGNSIVDVFFGCTSTNPIINGIFLSLQAGIVIVLLFILKDVIPFT